MRPSEHIAGLGARTDFIAQVPATDPVRLRLTGDELTLFASIGRSAQISEVLAHSGLEESHAISLLLSLRAKGAIAPAKVQAAPAAAPVSAAAEEEVDLPPERKQEILDLERALENANHFQVLGLLPDATPEQIKQSYYDASRRYHPDRYYGKNLGSFRGRIDRIFKRVSEAYQVLSDEQKRKAYEKAHPELASVSSSSSGSHGAAGSSVSPERMAERRARLMRHPYLARTARTGELLTRARANIEKGELGIALTDLQVAAQAEPKNREIQELIVETRRRYDKQRAKDEVARGLEAERLGNVDLAMQRFRAALAIDERHSTAAYKAASLLVKLGGDADEARVLARKAVEVDPKNADFQALLGGLLVQLDKKQAKRHLDEALKLEPDHPEAKKHAKKLRWPF